MMKIFFITTTIFVILFLSATTYSFATLIYEQQHDTCNKLKFVLSENPVCNRLTDPQNACTIKNPGATNNTNQYTFKIQVLSNDGKSHSFCYGIENSFCTFGYAPPNGGSTGCSCWGNVQIAYPCSSTGQTLSFNRTPISPYANCGTYQDDFYISSVDGNTSCTMGDSNVAGLSGYCETGTTCGAKSSPTNTPVPAKNNTISGTVFLDINKNGVFDSGEKAYKGRNAKIKISFGLQSFTQTIPASGAYNFTGLSSGKWCATLTVAPTGYAETSGTVDPQCVNLTGSTNGAADFGILPLPTDTPTPTLSPTPIPTFSISGNIYVDVDGIKRYNTPPDTGYSNTILIIVKDKKGNTAASVNQNGPSYTTGTTLPAGQYTVIYDGPPTGYYISYPLTGTPPSFSVTLGNTGCRVNANDASCQNGNIINLNFGINNAVAWIQNVCGDMRLDTGIIDKIPPAPSCGSTRGSYAIQTNPAVCTRIPGVAFTGNVDPDFGQGQASANPYNMVVGGSIHPEIFSFPNAKVIPTSYRYLADKTRQAGITPIDLSNPSQGCNGGNISFCKLKNNLQHGVYQANGDLHLQQYNFTNNQNYLFLITGNLYIEGNITIEQGSTATFAVKGNIIVPNTVGNTNRTDTTPNIEGFYTTDNSFIVNGIPNICSGGGNDERLNISGNIITNAGNVGGSFINNRTLCSYNAQCPAVSIAQRPDLLVNAPSFIKNQHHLWQEVAP